MKRRINRGQSKLIFHVPYIAYINNKTLRRCDYLRKMND